MAQGPKFEFDLATFRKGIVRQGRGYAAVRETIRLQGMGETIVSMRKRYEYDNRKPMHGRFIAWLFANKMHRDLFEMEGEDFEKIETRMVEEIEAAFHEAWERESEQAERVKKALLRAAQDFADAAQKRVTSGYLGRNLKAYREKKAALAKYGVITSEFGVPAPRGISTGRFYKGIRARWRQGRL